MKHVLYIDCCIRRNASRTRHLAERFLASLGGNKGIEIETLCLMDEPLVCFTDGFFEQRERLLAENALDHPRFRYAHQFRQADAIIIAAPFWDLSFPALLKVYIENVCVDGITFGTGERGCYGTCRADRMVLITTRGGIFTGSPQEMGARYLESMSGFFGIPRFDCIAAEGLDIGRETPESILARAQAQAEALARTF